MNIKLLLDVVSVREATWRRFHFPRMNTGFKIRREAPAKIFPWCTREKMDQEIGIWLLIFIIQKICMCLRVFRSFFG